MTNILRTRWAALGAAVAVTLGAGGLVGVDAARTTGVMPVYVSLASPCRVVDTRPASNVGSKNTPIGPGEANAHTIRITGGSGECTGALAVPTDAVAVSLNLTATNPTTNSNFRVYPAGSPYPSTSNLNFGPGRAPVANKVDVGLSGDGRITLANAQGTADAAIDVFGYYVDHDHRSTDIIDEPGVAQADGGYVNTTPAGVVVTKTFLRAPTDGYVHVQVDGDWTPSTPDEDTTFCQIRKGAVSSFDPYDPFDRYFLLSDHDTLDIASVHFTSNRLFPISAADNPTDPNRGQQLSLVCKLSTGSVLLAASITALYFPTSYERDS